MGRKDVRGFACLSLVQSDVDQFGQGITIVDAENAQKLERT